MLLEQTSLEHLYELLGVAIAPTRSSPPPVDLAVVEDKVAALQLRVQDVVFVDTSSPSTRSTSALYSRVDGLRCSKLVHAGLARRRFAAGTLKSMLPLRFITCFMRSIWSLFGCGLWL